MASTLQALRAARPFLWLNPALPPAAEGLARLALQAADIDAASERWERWRPALAQLFPELAASGGLIESGLTPWPAGLPAPAAQGRCFLKQDNALPVAGSIKARGGIHEVLCAAEQVMRDEGIAFAQDPLAPLGVAAQQAFARHTVSVGSTGNLGLSIGVAASGLGFRSVVHMSSIAKPWKKQRLRSCGVDVREHSGDFTAAVAAGRTEAAADKRTWFVDDEQSSHLFLGYATAASRLAGQLQQAGVQVDGQHPLFVYLPCGVGGAPAGISFGLKHVFGDAVHCFFAEPCASPSMLARLATGAPVTVYSLGLDNRTEADGLAVAQASELAAATAAALVAGVFTVDDATLLAGVRALHGAGIKIEPSAAASLPGPGWLLASEPGRAWLVQQGLERHMAQATHVLWSTGGLLMPDAEHARLLPLPP